jgi:hypothetical protein
MQEVLNFYNIIFDKCVDNFLSFLYKINSTSLSSSCSYNTNQTFHLNVKESSENSDIEMSFLGLICKILTFLTEMIEIKSVQNTLKTNFKK